MPTTELLTLSPLHTTENGSATPLVMDAHQVPSALLARLVQEVQSDAASTVTAYNRTHNRHNRGR
jgi:hypothetical protein